MPAFQKFLTDTNKTNIIPEESRSSVVVYSVIFCNITTISVKFSLFLDLSGANLADETKIISDVDLSGKTTLVLELDIPVNFPTTIGASCDTSNSIVVTTLYRNEKI